MFKIIDVSPDGAPEESFDTARVAPPPEGTIRWIELAEPDRDALELLRQRFAFHPLAIEDCATFELHSKLEDFPDHLFVVLHTFASASDDPCDIQTNELHAFLGNGYLVTVHERAIPRAEAVWTRASSDRNVLSRGPGWALYLTADAMIHASYPLLQAVANEVTSIEESVLSDAQEGQLRRIFQIRSSLVTMRRIIRPVGDVTASLTRRTEHPLDARTATYFRDLYDHVRRCNEEIEEALGLVANCMDAYQSSVSNRINQIMRRLTIFNAIFLPLGFITGFFGQNFEAIPFRSEGLFWLSLGLIAVVPLVLLIWFTVKRWL